MQSAKSTRKTTGLSALGYANSTAKRCKHAYITMSITQADELHKIVKDLKAENERLRKAGDDMASRIKFDSKMEDEDWGVSPRTPECVKAWLAAKGVQS
jgi:hypothetical protein